MLVLTDHRVFLDGTEVHLTPTELAIVRLLFKFRGTVVTQRMLLSELYVDRPRGRVPENKIIDVLVCKVRAKMPGHRIKTAWGRGYCWTDGKIADHRMTPDRKVRLLNRQGVDGQDATYEVDVARLRVGQHELDEWRNLFDKFGVRGLKVSAFSAYEGVGT